MTTSEKTIRIVWNYKGQMINLLKDAVVNAYKTNSLLPEEFSDMFTYKVVETDTHIVLIPEYV